MDIEKHTHTINIVVTIILGISGLIVLFLVSPDNLVMKPNFELAIEYSDSLDKAYVINKGWAQAKNVMISVEGTDNLILKKSYCLEEYVF